MADRVDYLFEPDGTELQWDALKAKMPPIQDGGASLSGPTPKYSQPLVVKRHPDERSGLAGTRPADKVRELTPDELLAQAKAMLDAQRVQTGAQMDNGASAGDRDAAGNRMPDWLRNYR